MDARLESVGHRKPARAQVDSPPNAAYVLSLSIDHLGLFSDMHIAQVDVLPSRTRIITLTSAKSESYSLMLGFRVPSRMDPTETHLRCESIVDTHSRLVVSAHSCSVLSKTRASVPVSTTAVVPHYILNYPLERECPGSVFALQGIRKLVGASSTRSPQGAFLLSPRRAPKRFLFQSKKSTTTARIRKNHPQSINEK